MIYQYSFTIPAATLITSPIEQLLKVSQGTIKKVGIIFPPGCAALAHVQVYRFGVLLFPSSENQSFVGDTFPITFSPDYLLSKSPFELLLKGWNNDSLYDHTPVISIEIVALGKTLMERIFAALASPVINTEG